MENPRHSLLNSIFMKLNVIKATQVFLPSESISKMACSAAVSVLHTGRGRASFLLSCAREIWLYTAQYKFQLHVEHIPGQANTLADALSRYHLGEPYRAQVHKHAVEHNVICHSVDERLFKLAESITDYK